MKKERVISIFIFSFLMSTSCVFGEEGINMDSEYLKINNKSQVYTSITDMYGIALFTDKTMEQKAKLQSEEATKLKKAEESIFIDTDEKKSSEDELTDKVEEYNLFAKPHTETKIKYVKNDAGVRFISVISIIALSVLTGIFTVKYYEYKRKKDADSVEYNNYTGF